MASNFTDSIAFGSLYLQNATNPFNWSKFQITGRDVTSDWLDITVIRNQVNLFTDNSQDDFLYELDLAARFRIEDYLGKYIFPVNGRTYYEQSVLQQWQPSLDLPQVRSDNTITISSVQYYDTTTPQPVLQTLATTDYFFDPTGNKVIVLNQPGTVNPYMTAPILVNFTIPADPISTYPSVKQAALLLIGHWYTFRSDTEDKRQFKLPHGFDVLLRPYKDLVI